MLLSHSNYISNYELAQKCGGLVAIGSACSEINDEKNKDYRTEHGVERVDCKHTSEGFFYRAIRLGERVEEGVEGANEGRSRLTQKTLAESSPRSMGATVKGKSEIVQVHRIPDMSAGSFGKDCQPSDFPAPPYGSGLRPKKWDDWSHVKKEEEQGRIF